MKMKMKARDLGQQLLLVIVLAVVVLLPFQFGDAPDGFEGTDTQAVEMIKTISPDYQPWARPITEVLRIPSEALENLLFTVQAALGAGIVGYYFGYFRGQRPRGDEQEA